MEEMEKETLLGQVLIKQANFLLKFLFLAKLLISGQQLTTQRMKENSVNICCTSPNRRNKLWCLSSRNKV